MQTGQKIALLRKNAGMSQDELAEKLFVSRELVSKWETGKRLPDSKTVTQISEIFNVPREEIADTDNRIYKELSDCFPDDRELSAEQSAAVLNSFLKTLSKTEHTVFISRYYYGHSSEQTASLLGLRSAYIRKKLTVLRKKLILFTKEYSYG